MKVLEALKQRSQRKRLAQLGKSALAAYDIPQAKLQFITDTENTVFRVDTPSNTYALRIHSPEAKSASEIEGELSWLAALRRETILQVPEPVPTSEGRLIQEFESPSVPGPRPIVLFHWLSGKVLGDHLDPALTQRLGVIMAQLHNHAEQFELPAGTARPPWEEDRGPLLTNYLQASKGLSDADLALCLEAIQQSSAVIAQVDTSQNYGLIHCDLHSWNCLLHEGEIGVIDFDDCRMGSFVEDIAITLSSFDDYAEPEALCTAFLKGYTQVRPLPTNFETEAEAFMASRGLGLISWVLSWPSLDHQPFGRAMLANSLQRAKRYLGQAE